MSAHRGTEFICLGLKWRFRKESFRITLTISASVQDMRRTKPSSNKTAGIERSGSSRVFVQDNLGNSVYSIRDNPLVQLQAIKEFYAIVFLKEKAVLVRLCHKTPNFPSKHYLARTMPSSQSRLSQQVYHERDKRQRSFVIMNAPINLIAGRVSVISGCLCK
jgi:hypothetical protein